MCSASISFLWTNIACNYYSKCPKILYTKVSDKIAYANSADPNQTAGAVWLGSTLFATPLGILRNNCKKKRKI